MLKNLFHQSQNDPDIVLRLREPSNWLRQARGESWKDTTNHYDAAPFEAALEIERLRVEVERLRGALNVVHDEHLAYQSGVRHPGAASCLSLNAVANVRAALAQTEDKP